MIVSGSMIRVVGLGATRVSPVAFGTGDNGGGQVCVGDGEAVIVQQGAEERLCAAATGPGGNGEGDRQVGGEGKGAIDEAGDDVCVALGDGDGSGVEEGLQYCSLEGVQHAGEERGLQDGRGGRERGRHGGELPRLQRLHAAATYGTGAVVDRCAVRLRADGAGIAQLAREQPPAAAPRVVRHSRALASGDPLGRLFACRASGERRGVEVDGAEANMMRDTLG